MNVIAQLGKYRLMHDDYPDGERFNKNWFQINIEDRCVHCISGFSYSFDGIFEYFNNWVESNGD